VRAALLIATVFCLGCLGDSTIAVTSTRGAYVLRSINASPLPYTITANDGSQTVIVDDVIGLLEGNVFNETVHSLVTVNGKTTSQTTGTSGNYGFQNTSISMTNQATNASRSGLITGNTLTIVEAGLTWTYSK